jgi:hypothetical protein
MEQEKWKRKNWKNRISFRLLGGAYETDSVSDDSYFSCRI